MEYSNISEKNAANLLFTPTPSADYLPKTQTQSRQFTKGSLHRSDLDPVSAFGQFHKWFAAAQESDLIDFPERCCLSTAALPSGRVSSRMVCLKEANAQGFVICSNFGTSRKGSDLATNPWASLTFWWEGLERQVRIEGRAVRLSSEESQTYFDNRERDSKIGAWASHQSSVLRGRRELERQVNNTKQRFAGQEAISVPEYWGALRINPESIEFWQGRQNRLHDRFMYTRNEGSTEWTVDRLSP